MRLHEAAESTFPSQSCIATTTGKLQRAAWPSGGGAWSPRLADDGGGAFSDPQYQPLDRCDVPDLPHQLLRRFDEGMEVMAAMA